MISSFLHYPVKFVDICVENQGNLPESIPSDPPTINRLKFVEIDAMRKEIILVRITREVQELTDSVGDFIEGCREAAVEGAVMFETHMYESHLPTIRGGRICSTIISELRKILYDYGLGMAWYRIPRVKISAVGTGLVDVRGDKSTHVWSYSEPGFFLAGEVYAERVSQGMDYNEDWLVECVRGADIVLSDNEIMFLRAASDLGGDPRTKCNVPAASYQGRLSAVAELTLKHKELAAGIANRIGEKIMPIRFILPLICVRMFGALQWTDRLLGAWFDPWWTLLANHCVRLNNPFIGHLVGESSTFTGMEISWFSTEAIEVSRNLQNGQELRDAIGISMERYEEFLQCHERRYTARNRVESTSEDGELDDVVFRRASRS